MRKIISIAVSIALIISMFSFGSLADESNVLKENNVSLSCESYVYDGNKKEPEVTVAGLTLDKDYVVSYVKNVNPGTAEVIVSGTGSYSGSVTKTFSIVLPSFTSKGSIEKKISYDYVVFGSYPQTQIVDSESLCGTYNHDFFSSEDYIADSDLYLKLMKSSFNKDNDTEIDGVKYHRIKMKDAVNYSTDFNASMYTWDDSTTYCYFKYEPIKWRVLYKSDNDAFLLSEKVLDHQLYNSDKTGIVWEDSSLRKWLNETFLNRAFTASEKEAVKETTVTNENNIEYNTPGGSSTLDRIFLLSESEVFTNNAVKYGFLRDADSSSLRAAKSSTFAKAMGAVSDLSSGCCSWWLRSPGKSEDGYSSSAAAVLESGAVKCDGSSVNDKNVSVRPAIHLDLSNRDVYEYVDNQDEVIDTISIDEIMLADSIVPLAGGKNIPPVTVLNLDPETDYDVSYTNIDTPGIATVTVSGKGKCSGSISLNYAIVNEVDISSMDIEILEDDIRYDGKACCPDISFGNLVEGTDYEVSYEDNNKVGTGRVIVTGIKESGYTGSVSKTFEIKKAHKALDAVRENVVKATYSSKGSYNLVTRCAYCNEILSSKKVTVSMLKLGKPSEVKAYLKKYDKAYIRWDKVKGATGYYCLYRKGKTGEWKKKTTANNHISISLKDDTYYQFKVIAYAKNSSGKIVNKGEASSIKSLRSLKKMNVPYADELSSGKVKVSWSKLKGATGYQVCVTAKSNGRVLKTTTKKLNKKLKHVSKGNKYVFKVRAYKVSNGKRVYGPWSKSVTYVHR